MKHVRFWALIFFAIGAAAGAQAKEKKPIEVVAGFIKPSGFVVCDSTGVVYNMGGFLNFTEPVGMPKSYQETRFPLFLTGSSATYRADITNNTKKTIKVKVRAENVLMLPMGERGPELSRVRETTESVPPQKTKIVREPTFVAANGKWPPGLKMLKLTVFDVTDPQAPPVVLQEENAVWCTPKP